MGGFTSLFKAMLNHPNIVVQTGCDAKPLITLDENLGRVYVKGYPEEAQVIYTGALDSLLDYQFGALPYRTIRFNYKTYNEEKHLAAPFVVYPLHKTMTRRVEFKSITGQVLRGVTTVLEEYPEEYNHAHPQGLDPFYPIISQENGALFAKYKEKAEKYSNLITCGRLADYSYYDMDNAVYRAFEVFDSLR
jgi:UDP-galactopyranose mutase